MNPRLQLPAILFATLALLVPARAQVAVTGITYGTLVDGVDTIKQGNNQLNFQNQYTPVNEVTTGAGQYGFIGPTADSIVVRRNTGAGNPNNTTVIYQTSASGNTNPLGEYETSVANLLLSGNLTEGLRNPFANGTGAQNGNIERIDFNLTNYVVQADDALVFFSLETAGSFIDGFRIAAYTGVGTVNGFANAPNAYVGTGLLVAPSTFNTAVNSPTGGTSGNFERATYTNGDNLSGNVTNPNLVELGGGLNLVGVLIRFSDLGVTAGTTIQGFSLMGADVVVGSSTDLVNWNSTTNYLTNTSATGLGDMDLMAFGATVGRPVPEPSTYGAILMGATLAGWFWRRKKFSATAAA